MSMSQQGPRIFPRKEIVAWVEAATRYKYQELRNGVFLCTTLLKLFPQQVSRTKFMEKPVSDYNCMNNLRLAKKILDKYGLLPSFNTAAILASKNNFELANWLRNQFETKSVNCEDQLNKPPVSTAEIVVQPSQQPIIVKVRRTSRDQIQTVISPPHNTHALRLTTIHKRSQDGSDIAAEKHTARPLIPRPSGGDKISSMIMGNFNSGQKPNLAHSRSRRKSSQLTHVKSDEKLLKADFLQKKLLATGAKRPPSDQGRKESIFVNRNQKSVAFAGLTQASEPATEPTESEADFTDGSHEDTQMFEEALIDSIEQLKKMLQAVVDCANACQVSNMEAYKQALLKAMGRDRLHDIVDLS